MVEINRLEDLTKLGSLTKDLLTLTTDGIIKFMKPMKIPFGIKVTGDTVFTGAQLNSEVHFGSKKAIFSSTSNGSSLAFKNICIRSDTALFDIKQNTLDRLVLDGCYVDAPDLGVANFKALHLSELRCTNPNQQPLEIGSCNSITALGVTSSTNFPLLDLSETKTVRDHIVVRDFRDHGAGGLISLGVREADETYLLATIPKRGIMVKRVPNQPCDLLRVIHNGYYVVPELNAVRKYFG